jgi:N-terminal acetyltransferase B complex non-catalytic subunit
MRWLWVFLKVYIRAFQQASDMNDDVEEKLLVGDRPKHSRDPLRLHRKERLMSLREEDLQDVRAPFMPKSKLAY